MVDKCECKCCKLQALSFGMALGILWAAALFIMALVSSTKGAYGMGFVQSIGSVYLGYTSTFAGALIGAVWGFVDAFIGGAIFAWLYNLFCKK